MAQTRRTDVLFFLGIVGACALLGYLNSFVDSSAVIIAFAAVALFVVGFVRVEFALYVLIFSMLLSPEFVVGSAPSKAALNRGVTLRLEDLLLGVIGFGWFAKTAVHKELGLFLKTPLNRPIALYLLVCVVSTGLGTLLGNVNPKIGFFFVLKYFEYFIVYFMAVNHLQDKSQAERFIFCFLLTCLLISVYGFLQIPAGGRVTAPFEGESGEPNTLGGYLVLMMSVAGALLLSLRRTWQRFALAAIVGLGSLTLLFTESRSSYLAILPAYIALVFLSRKKAVLAGLLAVGIALAPMVLPQRVMDRVLYTVDQEQQPGQLQVGDVRLDTSTTARLYSWSQGLKKWMERPVFGWGVTGAAFMDAQYPRLLMETGIVGFLAFLYLIKSVLSMAIASFRNTRDPLLRGVAMGFTAGTIGLLFHAIGANTFIIVRIMEPFWFLAAIVVMSPQIDPSQEAAPVPAPAHPWLPERFRQGAVRG